MVDASDAESFLQSDGLNVTEFADKVNVQLPDVNSSQLFANAWNSMPPELLAKLELMLDIGKWVLIAILLYFGVKIIYHIIKFNDSKNMAILAENSKQNNKKIDILILQVEEILKAINGKDKRK